MSNVTADQTADKAKGGDAAVVRQEVLSVGVATDFEPHSAQLFCLKRTLDVTNTRHDIDTIHTADTIMLSIDVAQEVRQPSWALPAFETPVFHGQQYKTFSSNMRWPPMHRRNGRHTDHLIIRATRHIYHVLGTCVARHMKRMQVMSSDTKATRSYGTTQMCAPAAT